MYRSISLFSVTLLLLGACSQTYNSAQNNAPKLEKMQNIEDESITRMSFVPMSDVDDDVEVVIYQDESALNEIMPASGEDLSDKNLQK